MSKTKTRILWNIALVVSLLYLPWWAGAVVALSAAFLVEGFYEVVIYGILSDALYGTALGFHGFHYVATSFTVVVLILASIIRGKLVW